MKSGKRVLAFDFGASSGRAIVGTLEDGIIKMEEVHRFSNDPVIVLDTMYWDTLRQFYEIKQGMIKANLSGGFESIGIDTWGVDFGLLDSHGELLQSAVHYRDERTKGMVEESKKVIDPEQFYEITGIQFMELNTAFQLFALSKNKPWLLEQADKMLLTPDLFHYFLTGKLQAEYSMATTTQMLDARTKKWSEKVIDSLGIPKKILPPIRETGSVVGNLKDSICEELGIPNATVIAVASHDTQSAVVAVPTKEEDFIFISCGTWSLFGTELQEPVINEESKRLNVTNEGGYGGKTTFLKNIIGLWLVQESRRQWQREGSDYSFGQLEEMASKVEPLNCFIDPDAPEFVPAGNIPKRIQKFCERTNQYIPKTVGEIVCCINQSLAMKYRYALEQIETCVNKNYDSIHMIGGGIQSKLLCQMTANASGRIVKAGPVEATALGNIAVQFITLGEIKDIKEARQIIKHSEINLEYLPKNKEIWEEAYKKFLTISSK